MSLLVYFTLFIWVFFRCVCFPNEKKDIVTSFNIASSKCSVSVTHSTCDAYFPNISLITLQTTSYLFDWWRATPQRVCTLPSLDKFRNWRAAPQQCCTKNYVLANNSVANVSVTLWFCLQRSCKKCLVPCDSVGFNAVVKRSVLSFYRLALRRVHVLFILVVLNLFTHSHPLSFNKIFS